MSDKEVAANEIVKRYALYAGGAGLIPMPAVDFAAIAALELKMISEIGNLYGLPFDKDRVKPVIGAIIGGYSATRIGYGVGGSMLKSVPILGQAIGFFSVPAFGAGVTYAVGKIFITHFASGGTFLDLNPDKVREYYAKPAAA